MLTMNRKQRAENLSGLIKVGEGAVYCGVKKESQRIGGLARECGPKGYPLIGFCYDADKALEKFSKNRIMERDCA